MWFGNPLVTNLDNVWKLALHKVPFAKRFDKGSRSSQCFTRVPIKVGVDYANSRIITISNLTYGALYESLLIKTAT